MTSHNVDVVAAVLDDATGEVEWLGCHPLADELLKAAPQDVTARFGRGAIAMVNLPEPLSASVVGQYLAEGNANRYYFDVTHEYYYRPAPSVPRWNLFRPDIWQYSPWFGIWIPNFAPFPSYHPWNHGVLANNPSWTHDQFFFIGYNRRQDFHHIPSDFHPVDPRWNLPIFLDPTREPGWSPGSPWNVIWHRDPNPNFHPGPNHYHGSIGSVSPGVPHHGGDHPGGNSHFHAPWHNNTPSGSMTVQVSSTPADLDVLTSPAIRPLGRMPFHHRTMRTIPSAEALSIPNPKTLASVVVPPRTTDPLIGESDRELPTTVVAKTMVGTSTIDRNQAIST